MPQHVMFLEDVDRSFIETVGKKGANLGEMAKAGFRVPAGFCVPIEAYRRFIEANGVREKIFLKLDGLSKRIDDIGFVDQLGTMLRELIQEQQIPEGLEEDIISKYRKLCEKSKVANLPVAVRSSGPISMPGQYDTYLNVVGEQQVLDKIREVWASSFSTRSIVYRYHKGLPVGDCPIGVVVLEMVDAKSAGVCLTINPVSRSPSEVVIESSWGLGEMVVSGQGVVDRFIVDKSSLQIMERKLAPKNRMIIPETNGVAVTDVPLHLQWSTSLQDEEIKELARIGKELEEHFGEPQDIEWAITSSQPVPESIVLLQSRPAR